MNRSWTFACFDRLAGIGAYHTRREFRLGEKLMLVLLGPVRPLLPASIRPIDDVAVARAMLATAHAAVPGGHIIPSGEMQRYSI